MIQVITMAALAAFFAGSSLSWYFTSAYKDTQCAAKVESARAVIAEASQKATESALQRERTANQQLNSLEVEHATVRQSLDKITADNRRLAAQLGGLRDPGTRGRVNPVPTTATVPSQPESQESASGRLSAAATEFLLDFAQRADAAASYAAECRDWATVVTGEGPLTSTESP